MSEKPEVSTVNQTEGAGVSNDAGVDKKPEAGLVGTAEKPTEATTVEDAATGVANLSVADDKKAEETPSDAPPTAKEADNVTATTGPFWPETSPDHPLTKFYDLFESLTTEASHNEVYGIELTKSQPFHTKLILQKFLRANQNDLEKAKQQLLETLKWRKEFNPAKAAEESFEKQRFDGLGYVLEVEGVPESPNKKDIVTFNIYGAVKDNKATFGDIEGFLRWRVGLMEKSVQRLNLRDATTPIPNFGEGPDSYQGYQIHDYLQVSFLRRDPHVKAATSKTIETLGRYYPETLSRKFFVNVPIVMGWVYTAIKMVVAKETAKKFTVLSYGNQLAVELGQGIPKEYGGTKGELKDIGDGMIFSE
ncbi:Non-classical phosphatidylinositol transfer protein (PITP) [Coniothyrium glycines]